MTVSPTLDEREDIHRSTEAAVQYLARMHEKFGDWALALAAYNAGPRTVLRAIRKAGSRDYWTVAQFLPRETRQYVPRFLAATYLVNYYHAHALTPTLPDLDMQLTGDLTLHEPITYTELARIAQVPEMTLRQLNPNLTAETIQPGADGTVVTLPRRRAYWVQGYLNMPEEGRAYYAHLEVPKPDTNSHFASGYRLTYLVPDSTDNLPAIAELFQVEESLLHLWNEFEPEPVFDGEREVLVYLPDVQLFHLPKPQDLDLLPQIRKSVQQTENWFSWTLEDLHPVQGPTLLTYHILVLGESVTEVLAAYPGVDRADLLAANEEVSWVPGAVIRVPSPSAEYVER